MQKKGGRGFPMTFATARERVLGERLLAFGCLSASHEVLTDERILLNRQPHFDQAPPRYSLAFASVALRYAPYKAAIICAHSFASHCSLRPASPLARRSTQSNTMHDTR